MTKTIERRSDNNRKTDVEFTRQTANSGRSVSETKWIKSCKQDWIKISN